MIIFVVQLLDVLVKQYWWEKSYRMFLLCMVKEQLICAFT